MYDNIGEKIKGLAKFFFIVSAIVYFIVGILIIATNDTLVIIGLLIMLVGPIIAWISSWLLYGFGQLIANSDFIVKEYKRNNTISEKKVTVKKKINKKIETTVPQPHVDDYIDFKCPRCDEQISFTQDELKSNANRLCPHCGAEINTDALI